VYLPAEATVFRLPPELPWEVGVLTEPLAVCCRAVNLTRPRLRGTAVVVGAGAIGLLCVAAARAGGSERVILVGRRANRLELGAALGADAAIDTATEDPRARILALTEGRGADVVFETAGTPDAQTDALGYVRRGGVVTLIGATGGKTITVNTDLAIVHRELRIQGSSLSCGAYPAAIDLLVNSRLPFARLVTHRFPLAQAAEAVRASAERRDGAIKVVIDPRA
jgi:alcohol dehydrogenase